MGGLGPLVQNNGLGDSSGGGNYSSHGKLLVLINIQFIHNRVCRTKICNRDYLEH